MFLLPKAFHAITAYFSRTQPERELSVPVVALTGSAGDRTVLEKIASADHLELHFADTCGQAWAEVNRLQARVVICRHNPERMEWQALVRILAMADSHPCVILIFGMVDAYLLREVVANGGYDVVSSPLREDDTAQAISRALLHWKREPRGTHRLPNLARV
jgi:DNA-binding NtrC family response regulator